MEWGDLNICTRFISLHCNSKTVSFNVSEIGIQFTSYVGFLYCSISINFMYKKFNDEILLSLFLFFLSKYIYLHGSDSCWRHCNDAALFWYLAMNKTSFWWNQTNKPMLNTRKLTAYTGITKGKLHIQMNIISEDVCRGWQVICIHDMAFPVFSWWNGAWNSWPLCTHEQEAMKLPPSAAGCRNMQLERALTI